jgi:hypothetical protein
VEAVGLCMLAPHLGALGLSIGSIDAQTGELITQRLRYRAHAGGNDALGAR